MAGMFYSLREAAEKLNKTEQQVKQMVKDGKLREFRDGPNLLFKVDEVEALASEVSIVTPEETGADEISLAPETTETSAAESELIDAETVMADADTIMADEGISVLGETDSDRKVAEDAMGETKAELGEVELASSGETPLQEDMMGETKATSEEASLEEIEEDVNLETFGSGSGLLDLSLQADDTSLGDILDEIYTPETEGAQEAVEPGSAIEAPVDTEQMLAESGIAAPQPILEAPAIVRPYTELEPDAISNALGFMLFVPIVAIIYTAIVAIAAGKGLMPGILESIQAMVWYIMGGLVVAAALIVGVPVMLSKSAGKTTTERKAKKTKTKTKAKKAK